MDLWQYFTYKDYGTVLKTLNADKLVPKEVLGKNPQAAKYRFSSFAEYLCTLGLCAKIEQVITERDQYHTFHCNIRVLEQPGSSKLIALLLIPEKCRGEIVPGDKAEVHFRVGMDFEKAFWELKFIEPLPSSPPGVMTATIQRSIGKDDKNKSKDKDKSKDVSQFTPTTIPLPKNVDAAEAISSIGKHKGNGCKVVTLPRHSIFPYVFQALEDLLKSKDLYKEHPSIAHSFGTIRLEQEPRYDIYSSISDKTCIAKGNLGLNDSQMVVVQQGRTAPGGFVIAHGGPGTGKTQ